MNLSRRVGRQARSVGRNIRPLTCNRKSSAYQYGARNTKSPVRRQRNRQNSRPTEQSRAKGVLAAEAEETGLTGPEEHDARRHIHNAVYASVM